MALTLAALVFLPAVPAEATGVHPTITVTSTGDCPDTSVKVTVKGLYSDVDYDIRIDGVKQTVKVTDGVASFVVPNKGKQMTVSVTYKYKGKSICVKKCFTVKPVSCTPPTPPTPEFSGSVDACQTTGGKGAATLNFSNLDNNRSYWLTVQGSDRVSITPTGGKYTTTVDLAPGTYSITISSDATTKVAAIAAKTFSVTVEPCPEHTIKVDACQSVGGKGSVSLSFTGLDDSRTYWLTVGDGDRIRVLTTAGTASVTVDRAPGDYDVKLVADVTSSQPLTTVLTDKVTVKPCPEFTITVDACQTIGGTGTAGLSFSDLNDNRSYVVTIDGANAQTITSTDGKWSSTVTLAAGTHEVTIESAATGSLPAIEKVTLKAVVEPCPEPITLDLDTTCAADSVDGTVSVAVSGFVEGRDYSVLFTGADGENAVSKTLTAASGDQIVDGLVPGDYTVTVTDVEAKTETNAPLTWSKLITVVPCKTDEPTPPTTPPGDGGGDDVGVSDDSVTPDDLDDTETAGVSALPHTGLELAAPFALGSGFLGLGLGLLALKQIRARRRNKTA